MRRLAGLIVLLLTVSVWAAAPKKKSAPPPPPPPVPAAPDIVPHSIALFLGGLSKDGAKQVTFRATAIGTRFFIEEPTGVTVYRFDRGRYVKEAFMRNAKIAAAKKKYPSK